MARGVVIDAAGEVMPRSGVILHGSIARSRLKLAPCSRNVL